MNNALIENQNLIDLGNANNATELMQHLSQIADNPELKGQNLNINLGSINLSASQVISVKSFIENAGAKIDTVFADSASTQLAAVSTGLKTAQNNSQPEENPEQPVEENILDTETIVLEEEPQNTEEELLVEENDIEEIIEEQKNYDTLYIKQTVRSGQVVSHEGNIVIIGDCHPGCEINAAGDIIIWGILGGIAHAGAKGDKKAKIRALKIDAIQLRIADLFARRPDRFEAEKPERPDAYIPEEARIEDNEIIIFSINNK